MSKLRDKIKSLEDELWRTAKTFEEQGVHHTMVFFGSAHIHHPNKTQKQLDHVLESKSELSESEFENQLKRAKQNLAMSRYYSEAEELAFKLTEWSLKIEDPANRYLICSGGGPGIMEASNKGAHEAGGKSIGLAIEIPTEQESNNYASPELTFQFDHFLIRKFWFFRHVRALVVFPGGFGTLDELFEILTLLKTEKKRLPVPVILYGCDFWNSVINFDKLVEYGTISKDYLKLMHCCEDVDEAFQYITERLRS